MFDRLKLAARVLRGPKPCRCPACQNLRALTEAFCMVQVVEMRHDRQQSLPTALMGADFLRNCDPRQFMQDVINRQPLTPEQRAAAAVTVPVFTKPTRDQ